jgi:hypothetical protein
VKQEGQAAGELANTQPGLSTLSLVSPESKHVFKSWIPVCTHRPCHDAAELEEAAAAAASPQQKQRALAVCFVQKPQDGSADAALDVVLTPSYVYYSGQWLQQWNGGLAASRGLQPPPLVCTLLLAPSGLPSRGNHMQE